MSFPPAEPQSGVLIRLRARPHGRGTRPQPAGRVGPNGKWQLGWALQAAGHGAIFGVVDEAII